MVGYIVDLTVILDGIFEMATSDVSSNAEQVFGSHITSGHKDAIHRDIQSFVTEAVKGFTPLCPTWAAFDGDRLVIIPSLWIPPEV